MNRAVFLDRDNTLIENSGYLGNPEEVRLVGGAAEAVSRLRSAGYYVVVATNQSGVARGLFTEEQLAAVHQRMQDLLRERGTGLDALYYCPFLDGPEATVERYRRASELRKPRPGMLLQAARDLQLDLASSWMIGDAERDVEAGRAAGCRTVRIGLKAGETTAADLTAADLIGAVDVVLDHGRESRNAETSKAEKGGAIADFGSGISDLKAQPDERRAEAVLGEILEEMRRARREGMHADFSGAKLAGAISQAFAIVMLGLGLYASVEGGAANPDAWGAAVVRLLAAVVFQLLALTCFAASRRG